MTLKPSVNPTQSPGLRTRLWATLAILILFVLGNLYRYRDAPSDDLTASYVGCRLLTTGDSAHLYVYDPTIFSEIPDDAAWDAAAAWGGIETYLHPYVQTPLWAWSLRPLCRLQFEPFKFIFTLAYLLSFAACLWLAARFWTPALLSPIPMSVLCLGLSISQPFRYAMALGQTHILFLLLVLASLILAERRRPGWAGLLLALAAAVKVTPAALILYWALTRRRTAALSAVGWSAGIALLTLVVARPLVPVYLQDLNRIAHILLVSFNNQSLAATWLSHAGSSSSFLMLPLPASVRIASMLLLLVCTVAGALFDRRQTPAGRNLPFGAMIVLLATTLFAPITWTHYFIVLVAPLMLLWQYGRTDRRHAIFVGVAVVFLLNCRPLATNMATGSLSRIGLLRSEFYSGILCIFLLALCSLTVSRKST